jgi:hypothetical protein
LKQIYFKTPRKKTMSIRTKTNTKTHQLTITIDNQNIPLWDIYCKKSLPPNSPPSMFPQAMEGDKSVFFTNFNGIKALIKNQGSRFKERMNKTFELLINALWKIEPCVFSNLGCINFFFPGFKEFNGKGFEKMTKSNRPSLKDNDRLIPIFFLPILFSCLGYNYQDNMFAFNNIIEDKHYETRKDIRLLSNNLNYILGEMIGKDNVTNELYQKLKESEEKRIELEKELLRKEEEISILKKKVSNSLITMKKFSDMF